MKTPMRSLEWTAARFLEEAAKKPDDQQLPYLANAAAGWFEVAHTDWSVGEWWRKAYWQLAAVWGGWTWRCRLARRLTSLLVGHKFECVSPRPISDAHLHTVPERAETNWAG